MRRIVRNLVIMSALAVVLAGCGASGFSIKYSFSGTSIKPDVKTIAIEQVVNNAMKVNPTLANSMSEALKDKFKKLTSLEQVDMDGDLSLIVTIESYEVRAQGLSANETVAQNRLTVPCQATFENVKHPEESFENKSFAAYQD